MFYVLHIRDEPVNKPSHLNDRRHSVFIHIIQIFFFHFSPSYSTADDHGISPAACLPFTNRKQGCIKGIGKVYHDHSYYTAFGFSQAFCQCIGFKIVLFDQAVYFLLLLPRHPCVSCKYPGHSCNRNPRFLGNIINCYISSVFHHIPFILSHPVIPAPMTCG